MMDKDTCEYCERYGLNEYEDENGNLKDRCWNCKKNWVDKGEENNG